MRYNFRVKEDKDTGEFVIDMKCLNCDYEEVIPMDIFSELFSALENNTTANNAKNNTIFFIIQ